MQRYQLEPIAKLIFCEQFQCDFLHRQDRVMDIQAMVSLDRLDAWAGMQ